MVEYKELEKPEILKESFKQIGKLFDDALLELDRTKTQAEDRMEYITRIEAENKLLKDKYEKLKHNWDDLHKIMGSKVK